MCLRTPPARSDARRPGTANLRYGGRKGMLARDGHQPEATTYIPTFGIGREGAPASAQSTASRLQGQ